MMTKTMDTRDREIIISRLVDAPRELVWEVWTNPQHVKHWWGPNGFTNTIYEMEVKPNGVWRFMMHGPDGTDYPNKVVFEEVLKPERLVYTHGSDDPDDPNIFHTTVNFEIQGNKTLVIMKVVFATKEELERVIKEHHADEGGKQTLGRLQEYVSSLVKANA